MNERKYKLLTTISQFAIGLAELSKCEQRGVASIICSEKLDQILSIGINGGPKGGPDCLCNSGGKYTCIHSEANSIAKLTPSNDPKIMVCTLSPCATCAALIINAGITEVYFVEQWKDSAGIDLLVSAGITVSLVEEKLVPDVNAPADGFDEARILAKEIMDSINKDGYYFYEVRIVDAAKSTSKFEAALKLLAGHNLNIHTHSELDRQLYEIRRRNNGN